MIERGVKVIRLTCKSCGLVRVIPIRESSTIKFVVCHKCGGNRFEEQTTQTEVITK
jgi:hypothetical protein